MEYSVLIIMLALAQFLFFTLRVGAARQKSGVHAPKTVGNETWERLFRVQQNTLEQLIVFIPASLAFAYWTSPIWVVVPGAAFVLGRQIYSHTYIKDPNSRVLGMALSLLANVALVVGASGGIVMKLLE